MKNQYPSLFILLFLFFCWSVCGINDLSGEEQKGPIQTIEVRKIIDTEQIKGEKPILTNGTFSVAMRWTPLSKGKGEGNKGSNNGTLFSWGSGYFSGFRAYQEFSSFNVTFEMGVEALKRSTSAHSNFPAWPGVLHDLVCTYDGKQMVLYLDGKQVATNHFEGGISPVEAPFQTGFGGYGVGSGAMFVEKVELWDRVLSQEEVAARFEQLPEETKKAISVLSRFTQSMEALNLNTEKEVFEAVISNVTLPEIFRQQATNMLWRRALLTEPPSDACSLIFQEAENLLQQKKKEPESVKSPIFISAVGEILTALDQLDRSDVQRAKAFSLKNQFYSEYPEIDSLFKTIQILNSKMKSRALTLESKINDQRKNTLTLLSKAAESDKVLRLWLSPTGNDANDGSREKPLVSLAAALAMIDKQTLPAVVEVADGTYFAQQTTKLGGKDSPFKSNIIIKAATGAKPIFTGAKELKNFQSVTDQSVLTRLPLEARENIVVCDLSKEGIDNLGAVTVRGSPNDHVNPWVDLYLNGKAMELARWPNEGEEELKTGEVFRGPKATDRFSDSGKFRYDVDRPDRWKTADDIWVLGKWRHLWASLTTKIVELDRENKTIKIALRDMSTGMPYHFLNLLEELDTPGEFYIDRTTSKLYLYPPKEFKAEDLGKSITVEFPLLAQPFLQFEQVENGLIEGITFKGGRANALELLNCQNVYLQTCQIEQMGGSGLLLLEGSYCGAFDCNVQRIGSSGIRLRGGDRKTLTAGGHAVVNCIISEFCRVDRNYAPAVHVTGCGLMVANSLIYDSPHHAFRVDGNDHYLNRNEIHSVVYEFDDQSGVDLWADPTYRGNVIDENFWHHIGSGLDVAGQSGIRLDDAISGVRMNGNVFYRSAGGHFGGIQIHGGKDNVASDNLFIVCKSAFSFSAWPPDRYLEYLAKENVQQWIAEFGNEKFQQVYPFLDSMSENANRNYFLNNRAVNCPAFSTRGGGKSNVFIGNTSESIPSTLVVNDHGAPNPHELRGWIEKETGRDLSNIGLLITPGRPKGQTNVEHVITPHYFKGLFVCVPLVKLLLIGGITPPLPPKFLPMRLS